MSEQFKPSAEKSTDIESSSAEQKAIPSHERDISETDKQHGSAEQLENTRANIDTHAISKNEIHAHQQSQERQPEHPVLISAHLKKTAYTRTLTRTRKKLLIHDRAFSKIVHQPLIDSSSEFIEKTVARPSSMFGGALFALIGTSILLWITRHYGYEYNYLIALILYALGFALGLTVEGIWRAYKRRSSE